MLEAKLVCALDGYITIFDSTLWQQSLSEYYEHRIVLASLQYLSLIRLDVAYAVDKLSQFMHHPTT